ncbi:MAG: rhomboid family intramembrane serine protease [Bacteroidota bacterium]
MDLSRFADAPIATTIFILTIISSIQAFQNPELKAKMMYTPFRVVHRNEIYRLVSHALIHADWLHLGFNMLVFYFFAFTLENPGEGLSRLPQFGHLGFLMLYVFSLVLATIPALARHKDNDTYFSLGASGAVSGVLTAWILCYPGQSLMLIFIPIPIPGWLFGLLYIAYSFYASFRRRDNIAHDAHLWGAIAGILITILMKPDIPNKFLEYYNLG